MPALHTPVVTDDHVTAVNAGMRFFRIHRSGADWRVPNSHKPRLRIGGRFDAQQGTPGSWYASTSRQGALSEALFRHQPDTIDSPAIRVGDLAALRLTEVELVRSLVLVRLDGFVFQALRIPPSVTSTLNRHDYAISRQAAEDIRDGLSGTSGPRAMGLSWNCARNNDYTSIVLWCNGSRPIKGSFKERSSIELASILGDVEKLADLYGYAVLD
jgi:hypothetical protein